MEAYDTVAKQLLRQATLQPYMKLPAGRTVSLDEGRRLARLIHKEEERAAEASSAAVQEGSMVSPVVLEDSVAKRILLLRQKGRKAANAKAAIAHACRTTVGTAVEKVGRGVGEIAVKLHRKDAGGGAALRERRERNRGKKARGRR